MIVHLLITVYVKPGLAEEFLQFAMCHAEHSRNEPRCLDFAIMQNREWRSEFVLHEAFTSQEGLDEHRQTDHYRRWREGIGRFETVLREHREFVDCG